MSLWSINVFIFIVDVILFYLNISAAERRMKTRYPELHFRETPFTTVVVTAIKICLVSICPILNLGLLYILIFKDNELIEDAVQQAYDNYHKNNHSEVS